MAVFSAETVALSATVDRRARTNWKGGILPAVREVVPGGYRLSIMHHHRSPSATHDVVLHPLLRLDVDLVDVLEGVLVQGLQALGVDQVEAEIPDNHHFSSLFRRY